MLKIMLAVGLVAIAVLSLTGYVAYQQISALPEALDTALDPSKEAPDAAPAYGEPSENSARRPAAPPSAPAPGLDGVSIFDSVLEGAGMAFGAASDVVFAAFGVAVLWVGLLAALRLYHARYWTYAKYRLEAGRVSGASPKEVIALAHAWHQYLYKPLPERLRFGQPYMALLLEWVPNRHRGGDGATKGEARARPIRAVDGQETEALVLSQMLGAGGEAAPKYEMGDEDLEFQMSVICPTQAVGRLDKLLSATYRNARIGHIFKGPPETLPPAPWTRRLIRLRKRRDFLTRVGKEQEDFSGDSAVERMGAMMSALEYPVTVALTLRPTTAFFEWVIARGAFRVRERNSGIFDTIFSGKGSSSELTREEHRQGLAVQHSRLFRFDLVVYSDDDESARAVGSTLRGSLGSNYLKERNTWFTRPLWQRRAGMAAPSLIPSLKRGVLSADELPSFWHVPHHRVKTIVMTRNNIPRDAHPAAVPVGRAEPLGLELEEEAMVDSALRDPVVPEHPGAPPATEEEVVLHRQMREESMAAVR